MYLFDWLVGCFAYVFVLNLLTHDRCVSLCRFITTYSRVNVSVSSEKDREKKSYQKLPETPHR